MKTQHRLPHDNTESRALKLKIAVIIREKNLSNAYDEPIFTHLKKLKAILWTKPTKEGEEQVGLKKLSLCLN